MTPQEHASRLLAHWMATSEDTDLIRDLWIVRTIVDTGKHPEGEDWTDWKVDEMESARAERLRALGAKP